MRRLPLVLSICALTWLSGCEMLGIETPDIANARREADGKAIGAGCRHAARSVEQCYAMNKKAEKASVFAGWREMNDYMRENKIEPMPPEPVTEVAAADADEAHDEPAPRKGGSKH